MKIEALKCQGCGAGLRENQTKCAYCGTNHRIEGTPYKPLNNTISSGIACFNISGFVYSTGIYRRPY